MNCILEKLPGGNYRCKNCGSQFEVIIEQECRPEPYNKPMKYWNPEIYLSYYIREGDLNKFKCNNCGAVYEHPEAEAILHDCRDFIKPGDQCLKCGEENTKENHVCHEDGCEWAVSNNNSSRCKKCKLILEKPKKRICQSKKGVQGLGDVIHAVLQKVGIEQKQGCGCGKTQEVLNKILPLNQKKEATEDDSPAAPK